jgi:hypothetical protein
MNRIYGKPEAAVSHTSLRIPMADVIRSLSLEEKLELLPRLRADEPLSLPEVEPVPPVG